jgi:hypothetical protein
MSSYYCLVTACARPAIIAKEPCKEHKKIRVVQLVFWEQGSIKFVKVLLPLNCSKGLMCNFGNRALGFLPPPSNLPNKLCMFVNNYRRKRGPEWDYVIIVEQKKEILKVQCKCRVVQLLSSSEKGDKFGHKTKETSWPDTDYI